MAREQSRQPSFGSVYRRGKRWWIRYPHRGKQQREPGGLDGRGARTKEEAEEKLRQRVAEIADSRWVGAAGERLTVDRLLDKYVKALATKQAKSIAQVRCHLAAVREWFEGDRAVDVNISRLREYIEARLAEGAAPATVNRGLQALRAAFNLAIREDRLQRARSVHKLDRP
jgi:hypothetical protein